MTLSWSYSALKTYQQCPLKFKLGRIDKIREPTSEPMLRGTRIHDLAERYVKGEIKIIPAELKKFDKDFRKLKRIGAAAEEEWAFYEDWTQCGWDDPEVRVRMKIDVNYQRKTELFITDYKTGKMYPENVGQCSFYAMGALLLKPEIMKVNTSLWYLDLGEKQEPEPFHRHELPDMIAWWEREAGPMLRDKIFAPRPSYKCRWCYYSKLNAGHCEF